MRAHGFFFLSDMTSESQVCHHLVGKVSNVDMLASLVTIKGKKHLEYSSVYLPQSS